jgi:hypothetical protein
VILCCCVAQANKKKERPHRLQTYSLNIQAVIIHSTHTPRHKSNTNNTIHNFILSNKAMVIITTCSCEGCYLHNQLHIQRKISKGRNPCSCEGCKKHHCYQIQQRAQRMMQNEKAHHEWYIRFHGRDHIFLDELCKCYECHHEDLKPREYNPINYKGWCPMCVHGDTYQYDSNSSYQLLCKKCQMLEDGLEIVWNGNKYVEKCLFDKTRQFQEFLQQIDDNELFDIESRTYLINPKSRGQHGFEQRTKYNENRKKKKKKKTPTNKISTTKCNQSLAQEDGPIKRVDMWLVQLMKHPRSGNGQLHHFEIDILEIDSYPGKWKSLGSVHWFLKGHQFGNCDSVIPSCDLISFNRANQIAIYYNPNNTVFEELDSIVDFIDLEGYNWCTYCDNSLLLDEKMHHYHSDDEEEEDEYDSYDFLPVNHYSFRNVKGHFNSNKRISDENKCDCFESSSNQTINYWQALRTVEKACDDFERVYNISDLSVNSQWRPTVLCELRDYIPQNWKHRKFFLNTVIVFALRENWSLSRIKALVQMGATLSDEALKWAAQQGLELYQFLEGIILDRQNNKHVNVYNINKCDSCGAPGKQIDLWLLVNQVEQEIMNYDRYNPYLKFTFTSQLIQNLDDQFSNNWKQRIFFLHLVIVFATRQKWSLVRLYELGAMLSEDHIRWLKENQPHYEQTVLDKMLVGHKKQNQPGLDW